MYAVRARNGADQLIGIGIDHFGLCAVRDIQAVIVAVHVRVVPAAPAADLDLGDDFIVGAAAKAAAAVTIRRRDAFMGFNS